MVEWNYEQILYFVELALGQKNLRKHVFCETQKQSPCNQSQWGPKPHCTSLTFILWKKKQGPFTKDFHRKERHTE